MTTDLHWNPAPCVEKWTNSNKFSSTLKKFTSMFTNGSYLTVILLRNILIYWACARELSTVLPPECPVFVVFGFCSFVQLGWNQRVDVSRSLLGHDCRRMLASIFILPLQFNLFGLAFFCLLWKKVRNWAPNHETYVFHEIFFESFDLPWARSWAGAPYSYIHSNEKHKLYQPNEFSLGLLERSTCLSRSSCNGKYDFLRHIPQLRDISQYNDIIFQMEERTEKSWRHQACTTCQVKKTCSFIEEFLISSVAA